LHICFIRFSLLLLEPGEIYFQDFGVTLYSLACSEDEALRRYCAICEWDNALFYCFAWNFCINILHYCRKKLAKNKYLKSKITCVFFSSISVGMDPSSVIHFVKVFLQSLVYEYHFSMHWSLWDKTVKTLKWWSLCIKVLIYIFIRTKPYCWHSIL